MDVGETSTNVATVWPGIIDAQYRIIFMISLRESFYSSKTDSLRLDTLDWHPLHCRTNPSTKSFLYLGLHSNQQFLYFIPALATEKYLVVTKHWSVMNLGTNNWEKKVTSSCFPSKTSISCISDFLRRLEYLLLHMWQEHLSFHYHCVKVKYRLC